MPAEEATYIFPSNMTYKHNGKLENEEEILSNIRQQLTTDPKHMNAGCALIRLPVFVLLALACIFGIVGATPTVIAMTSEHRINIFILLGWFSVILGACASLYWSWMCLKAIVYGPPDFDQLALASYQRLITRGTLIDTMVIRSTPVGKDTHIVFRVKGKPFLYVTKHGAIKEGDSVSTLYANGICVLL